MIVLKKNKIMISKKIVEARTLKGMTQEELAELAKVNIRTIQRIESENNIPRNKTLELIAQALAIPKSELKNEISPDKSHRVGTLIMRFIFYIISNFILVLIFGFLTLDINSNLNSIVAAYFLSILIPGFIVIRTPNLSNIERVVKFGSGLIFYLIWIGLMHAFPTKMIIGFYPTILITIGILYSGKRLMTYPMSENAA